MAGGVLALAGLVVDVCVQRLEGATRGLRWMTVRLRVVLFGRGKQKGGVAEWKWPLVGWLSIQSSE